MPEKQTLQQFGQSIKAKHPEYKDMDDAALAESVLKKYPQYGDMVTREPAPAPATSSGTRTPTGEQQSGDTRNSIQRTLDNLTERDRRKEEFQTPFQIGRDALVRGVAEPALGLVSHPINAAKGLLGAIAEGHGDPVATGQAMFRPAIENTARELQESGPGYALPHLAGNLVGQAAAGEAAGGASRLALPAVGRGLQAGAGAVNDALIGTPSKALRFGAEPGLQMAKEGITGFGPASLSSKVQTIIPQAAAEHRAIVASAPPNTLINSGPLLSQPFTDAVAGATNPATGAGGVPAIKGALRTQRELANVIDPHTGTVTPSMRNPFISPLQATELKSNLYSRINYDNPSKMGLANTGLKGAAHNLKIATETAVPDSIPAGQRLHNLMSAKDILEPSARNQTIPTSKSGLLDRAVTGVGTNTASTMHGIGTALPIASAPIQAGVTLAPVGVDDRTQRLIQYLKGQTQ